MGWLLLAVWSASCSRSPAADQKATAEPAGRRARPVPSTDAAVPIVDAAPAPPRRRLSELVGDDAGEAAIGIDEAGRIIRDVSLRTYADEDSKSCHVGQESSGTMLELRSTDGSVEYFMVEPLRVRRYRNCKARDVRRPSARVRRAIHRHLVPTPPRASKRSWDEFSRSCRDSRIEIAASGPIRPVSRLFGENLRFVCENRCVDPISVRVEVGGKALGSWSLRTESIEDRCGSGTVDRYTDLSLTIVCSGDAAAIIASQQRLKPNFDCLPRGGISLEDATYDGYRVDLSTGDTAPLSFDN